MSDGSRIEWTDATWSPVTGCTKVSPGCDHCYIARTPPFRMAGRRFLTVCGRCNGHGSADEWICPECKGKGTWPGDGTGSTTGVQLHPERLDQPLKWRKPRMIFVCSMADLFHDDVPDGYIAQVFATMAATPQHTYQVLTKRHGRMRSLLSSHEFDVAVAEAWCALGTRSGATDDDHTPPYPLPNVHLGVSAENQQWADIRIPALLETPAAVRWVSAEPLLGPIDLCNCYPGGVTPDGFEGVQEHCNIHGRNGLGWLVIGGESGPNARPCEERWIRGMVEQCIVAGVPVFVKQLGGHPDKRHDIKEFPPGLQVRQYPAVVS